MAVFAERDWHVCIHDVKANLLVLIKPKKMLRRHTYLADSLLIGGPGMMDPLRIPNDIVCANARHVHTTNSSVSNEEPVVGTWRKFPIVRSFYHSSIFLRNDCTPFCEAPISLSKNVGDLWNSSRREDEKRELSKGNGARANTRTFVLLAYEESEGILFFLEYVPCDQPAS